MKHYLGHSNLFNQWQQCVNGPKTSISGTIRVQPILKLITRMAALERKEPLCYRFQFQRKINTVQVRRLEKTLLPELQGNELYSQD